MTDLRELYQELILDHSKRPRNFKALDQVSYKAEGYNPLCGDRLTLYLKIEGDLISDIGFQGSGCAISKASASMMTDAVKGKTISQARELFGHFHRMLSDIPADQSNHEPLGKLAVFAGVSEFPVRVKCATLAWHTLKAGLERQAQTVSTEE